MYSFSINTESHTKNLITR